MKLLRHRDATPPSRLERKFLHFWQSLDGTIRNVILSKPIEPPLHGIGTRVTFIHAGFSRTTDISDYPFGWVWFLDQLKKAIP